MNMKVFVTGSCDATSPERREEFERDCKKLGELLAKEKYEVLICALGKDTADRHVFEGIYNAINQNESSYLALRLYTALNDHSCKADNRDALEKIKQLEHGRWASIEWGKSQFWAIAHTKAIFKANLLFVIPAREKEDQKDNVGQIISIAQELNQIPVLVLPRYHQRGKDLYNSYSQYYLDKGVPDKLYSALEGSLEDNDICYRISQLIKTVVPVPSSDSNKKVFIVHGHNLDAKDSVARKVEACGLDPIVLQEQPDRGRTIIEKFEDCAIDIFFTVVLMTADDVGSAAGDTPEKQKRARQNVIFELGYFIGKLRRDRVCILYEKDIEIPSDLAGVLYIEKKSDRLWEDELKKVLQEAVQNEVGEKCPGNRSKR